MQNEFDASTLKEREVDSNQRQILGDLEPIFHVRPSVLA